MKIQTALFLTVLLVLVSFGVAHAKALFADDFEGGLSGKWVIEDFQEAGGKGEVVDEKGNKVLKIDATASWTLASYPGVASLKDYNELWATVRFKIDAGATPEAALGLLTSIDNPQGNWYVGFVDAVDLGIDENAIAWHNRVPVPFTFELGKWYNLKVAVLKKNLHGKMWPEGEDEPKDWLTEVKITSHFDDDGVGFVTYHGVICFDDLIVAGGEDELVMAVSSKEKLATTWAKNKAAY